MLQTQRTRPFFPSFFVTIYSNFLFSHISFFPPEIICHQNSLLSDLPANIQPGWSENPKAHWMFISSLFCKVVTIACLMWRCRINGKVWKNPDLVTWFSSFSLYIKQDTFLLEYQFLAMYVNSFRLCCHFICS